MALLAPAYVPRRPQETVLYDLARQNLETFLAHARANYEGGLPRYVEQELRGYLACGDFSRGFTRARCDACGHDLLVAFSCSPSSPPQAGDVVRLAPNVLSVRHWDRLLGGLLYAVQPRVDWATLLRRSVSVDALECPKCHGRLRVIAVITEHGAVGRILAHLGLPIESPPIARARDPTEDIDAQDATAQLALDIG